MVALAAFAIAGAPGWAQDARADQAKELKLSVAVGPAYALGQAAERWAKRIAEKSGGRLPVKPFPGATLSQRDPAREFIALSDGTADLALGSTLFWSMQVKELGVVGLPWLAPEPKQLDALLEGPVADALAAAVRRVGAVPLALAPLGHHELATKERAVRAPADLAGLRVRVTAMPALADFYAALGARVQAMGYADAQAAFAAGTLDAQDGTSATFAATRLHAVGLRRVVLWEAIAEAAVFAVNRERWESWTDTDRALVRDSAQESARELAELVRQENDAALAELRKSGMTIVRLTRAERAVFAAATKSAYDRWAAVAGEELVRAAEAAVQAAAP